MRELTYEKLGRPAKAKGPTAKSRAKRMRAESPVKKSVREQVSERDGFCKLAAVSPCQGVSEWAHVLKRAQTRGMKPEQRHTTAGSMKACTLHHRLYDAGRLPIAMTELGMNGPIKAVYNGRVVMIK